MSKLFQTKYRIMPVYKKGEKCGVMVYSKPWYSPIFMNAVLDVLNEKDEAETAPAFFKSDKEAMDYIKSIKTIC